MKLKVAAALLAAGSASVLAQSEAITSNVIHDYSQASVGYGYLHDIANSDINAHGAVASVSYDINNIVVGVSGGHFWVDEGSGELWNVSGTLGYVLRTMGNRLNVIPNVSLNYTDIESYDTTTLSPGVAVSYALTQQISVNAGYLYTFEVDDDVDVEAHVFTVGGVLGLTDEIGVGVTAYFMEEAGFSGITGSVSYHF